MLKKISYLPLFLFCFFYLPSYANENIQKESQIEVSKESFAEHDDIKNNEKTQTAVSKKTGWLEKISSMIEHSNSLFLRLLLVFLLGLLMSLTPCIYPMIPITAGILQTQTSRSFLKSFSLSFSYTLGVATTFSILGLLAAFAGQAMGSFINKPWFIIPLVLLLLYLALAMIGLYEMYIPRFMQTGNGYARGGSYLSAYIFGAMSGLVASPCLSPGLVCLLCIVTTLQSKLLGFILLFMFGVGLSVPLLIIGTFSNALNLLPKSGMWMVEIKRLFGFVMLGMCIYFLSYLFEPGTMQRMRPLIFLCFSLAFLLLGHYNKAKNWNFFYKMLAMLFAIVSIYSLWISVKTPLVERNNIWQNNYTNALQDARQTQKLLLIDIGAPYCSICKAIDKSLFSDDAVIDYIKEKFVAVKLDGSIPENKSIMQKYNVIGFPTILLINPIYESIIKKWGPELYGKNSIEFINELGQFSQR